MLGGGFAAAWLSCAAVRLLLLRHGESHSNAAPEAAALPEHVGDRLTDRGHGQAAAAALALRGCEATRLISSPMRRARETAEPLSRELGLEIEIDDGIYELRESEDYLKLAPEEQKLRRWSNRMAEHDDDPDHAPPGAESFNEVLARVRSFKRRLESNDPQAVILGMSHGLFLRFFFIDSLLPDFRVRDVARLWQLRTTNCGLSVFELDESRHPADPDIKGWRCATWMQPLAGTSDQ